MHTKIFNGTALVVSRSDSFQDSLRQALLQAGYNIRSVAAQQEGLQELRTLTPTFVIVDRTESGFAQLHQSLQDRMPILTASYHIEGCDECHCVSDLDDGATRAVCNASPAVLVALATAALRRHRMHQPTPDQVVAGEVTIDFTNYEVKAGGTPVPITPTQFRILRSLAVAPGQFLSRQALFNQVWGEGFAICSHTLDVTLSSLRRVLHSSGVRPDFIVTLKSVGFKLSPATLIHPNHHLSVVPRPSPILPSAADSLWRSLEPSTNSRPRAVNWSSRSGHPLTPRYQKSRRASAARSAANRARSAHYAAESSCKYPE